MSLSDPQSYIEAAQQCVGPLEVPLQYYACLEYDCEMAQRVFAWFSDYMLMRLQVLWQKAKTSTFDPQSSAPVERSLRLLEDLLRRPYYYIVPYMDAFFNRWLVNCLSALDRRDYASCARWLAALPLYILSRQRAPDTQGSYGPVCVDLWLPPESAYGYVFPSPYEYSLHVTDDGFLFSNREDTTSLIVSPNDRHAPLYSHPQRSIEYFLRCPLPDSKLEVLPSGALGLAADPRKQVMPRTIERSLPALRKSLALLDSAWPQALSDVIETVRYVDACHLERAEWRMQSSSSSKIPGAIFLTVNEWNPLDVAESLVHETSHLKLNFLLTHTRLFLNSFEECIFFHPWMSKPRPLSGVIYGIHAFINILDFHARVLSQPSLASFHQKAQLAFDRTKKELAVAFPQLYRKEARLTADGRQFRSLLLDRYKAIA